MYIHLLYSLLKIKVNIPSDNRHKLVNISGTSVSGSFPIQHPPPQQVIVQTQGPPPTQMQTFSTLGTPIEGGLPPQAPTLMTTLQPELQIVSSQPGSVVWGTPALQAPPQQVQLQQPPPQALPPHALPPPSSAFSPVSKCFLHTVKSF